MIPVGLIAKKNAIMVNSLYTSIYLYDIHIIYLDK